MGFVLHFGRTLHLRARVLGAEEGISRFPEPWAAWLQSHRVPVSQHEASSGRSSVRGSETLVAGTELWEGDSFCWRKLFTAAEAEWEGSQLGSFLNWRAPEHECESDSDGVTGAVTSIAPVAVRWSYVLPNFHPLVLSERNKERSGRTESPVAPLPQLGTSVKGTSRAFA